MHALSEYQQQAVFVQWMRGKYPSLTLFAIPNGEIRDIGTAVKLKKSGVKAGVADLYLMDYSTFIEFKRDKKCKQTPSQKQFEEICKSTGHKYILVYGLEDAFHKIERLINGEINIQTEESSS